MILVDIDVLIDVALDRQPHSEPTSELLDLIERGVETASITWHSVSNLYYIVNPTRVDIVTREFIREVADTDTESIRYATRLPMADFEDAMQVAAARTCNAQLIVTRNIRDYQQSPIPAVTPQQTLQQLT